MSTTLVGCVVVGAVGCSNGGGETEAQKQSETTKVVSTETPVTEQQAATEKKETEAPVTEVATEAPVVQTEAKETQAPETEAKETEAPVTEVATEAPTEVATEAPETEAKETEAVETEEVTEAPATEAADEDVAEEDTEEEAADETETEEEYVISDSTNALELKPEADGSYTLKTYILPYVNDVEEESTEAEATTEAEAGTEDDDDYATPVYVNVTLPENQRYIYGENLFLTTTKSEYDEDDTEVVDFTYQLLNQYTMEDVLFSAMDTSWMTEENGYANISSTEEGSITVGKYEYTVIKKEFDRVSVLPTSLNTDKSDKAEESTEAEVTTAEDPNASHFVIYDAFANVNNDKSPVIVEVVINDYGSKGATVTQDTLKEALEKIMVANTPFDIVEVASNETEEDSVVEAYVDSPSETEETLDETEADEAGLVSTLENLFDSKKSDKEATDKG